TRRGSWLVKGLPTASGQAVCLFNNNPDTGPGNTIDNRRRERELSLFRALLTEAAIAELGFGTYPPAGEKLGGYTYAILLDAGESQEAIVLDAIDKARNEAWNWFDKVKQDDVGGSMPFSQPVELGVVSSLAPDDPPTQDADPLEDDFTPNAVIGVGEGA